MAKRTRPELTRRDALKGLSLAAATAAVACRPDEPDGKEPPPLEGFDLLRSRIDVVVVLIMENRSFDHVFGALTLEEGRTDVDGLLATTSNPHPDGYPVTAFHTGIDCIADPPHSWDGSHAQFNDGANDGFVREYEDREPGLGQEAMGYLNRADQPASYALADAYTLCDRWFCGLLGPTQPNRFYFHCGESGGAISNDVVALKGGGQPSIYKVMEAAGKTWAAYYANLPGVLLLPDMPYDDPGVKPILQFFADAEAGTLPNLVFLEPAFGRADDHPPAHPLAGQIFIAQMYEALASSPQWERIAFFVTYDEHGGFHDHVPPPKAADERAVLGFDQRGFRVPGLVIGPWVKPGHVSHVTYDHTACLAFIEQLFQVGPLTEASAAADPMLDCFDVEAMQKGLALDPVALDPIDADPEVIYRSDCVTDGTDLRTAPSITGQPELEAFVRDHYAGTRHDRIDQTDAIVAELHARAEARGIVVRR